jgi:hypothetical protein
MLSTSNLTYDFGVYVRYVLNQKVILSPKLNLVPVRHIQQMMHDFKVKDDHAHTIGKKVYKKRSEIEYHRVYFIDLLSTCGDYLLVNHNLRLVEGSNWIGYSRLPEFEKSAMLFSDFKDNFDLGSWFASGGFGEHLADKWDVLWSYILDWPKENVIDWNDCALSMIKELDLKWESPDQTHAKDLSIWGLKRCVIDPMSYFEILDLKYEEGEYGPFLKSVRLNAMGLDLFKRISLKSKPSMFRGSARVL